MMRANYFCAGEEKTVDYRHHYALNVDFYTHFTSPIRRYCDVIVHRLLSGAIRDSDMNLASYKIVSGRSIAADLSKKDIDPASDLPTKQYSTDKVRGIFFYSFLTLKILPTLAMLERMEASLPKTVSNSCVN